MNNADNDSEMKQGAETLANEVGLVISEALSQGEVVDPTVVEEIAEVRAVPISAEELEKQALNHPGSDGDTSTPE